MAEHDAPKLKPVVWVASTRADLKSFPDRAQDSIGYALDQAQRGLKADNAKPLKGFGGAGVLEICEDVRGDTFRAVYTVQLRGYVFVLHCFQKKAKRGIATPQQDIDLIRRRLRMAELMRAELPDEE